MAVAREAKAVLQINVRAGHFLLRNGEHVLVIGSRSLTEKATEALRASFIIGSERSPAQDLEYGLRQLVEIALRALSPGINDPYTAIAVVNQLGAALEGYSRAPAATHPLQGRCREPFGSSQNSPTWKDWSTLPLTRFVRLEAPPRLF